MTVSMADANRQYTVVAQQRLAALDGLQKQVDAVRADATTAAHYRSQLDAAQRDITHGREMLQIELSLRGDLDKAILASASKPPENDPAVQSAMKALNDHRASKKAKDLYAGGKVADPCQPCILRNIPRLKSTALKPKTTGTKYEPDRWNKDPVLSSTNCYAYAANDPDGHPPGKPQPGEHSGAPFANVDAKSVGDAAVRDGMVRAPSPPVPKPGYNVVALVIDPGVDYHWYRLDDNGFWSHKPGNTAARDVDASGNKITDPETANRDYGYPNYSEFGGYFYVPVAGIRTGPP